MRGSWRLNRTATYWPPTLMAITVFLSCSPELLNQGPGGPASQGHVPHSSIFSPTGLISNWSELQLLNRGSWWPPLLGADFLYCILSSTDWTSCAPTYIIIWHPLFFLRASQFRTQFNSSMVKGDSPDIPRPDAPVIYTGAFPILTAWPGSISYMLSYLSL